MKLQIELTETDASELIKIFLQVEKLLSPENRFICGTLGKLQLLSKDLILALDFLESEKPSHRVNSDFFNDESFNQRSAAFWWGNQYSEPLLTNVIIIKKKFVRRLIEKLAAELETTVKIMCAAAAKTKKQR